MRQHMQINEGRVRVLIEKFGAKAQYTALACLEIEYARRRNVIEERSFVSVFGLSS